MTIETSLNETATSANEKPAASDPSLPGALRQVLLPFASLKLTVALFAMAIFIVLAGTFAQVDKDIWRVVDEYFRVPLWPTLGFARIDLQIFFPPSFFPSKPQVPGWFYFPGGWVIGAAMGINLLAAHLLRFKVQARGSRLGLGSALIAVGCLMTWLVIASGSNKEGVQEAFWNDWSTLWLLFKVGLSALWMVTTYGIVYMLLSRLRADSEQKPRALLWILASFEVVLTAALAWFFSQGEVAQLNDSSMRILWQLVKAEFAALVLLAGCMTVFKKRAGVVLLHGGVGLMMFSEFLVGTMAVEGKISLREGEVVDFARDIRSVELAVVDTSVSDDEDQVVVIPKSYLQKDRFIAHDSLPFDLTVVEYYVNSNLRQLKPNEQSPADAGVGTTLTVDEVKPVSGTDNSDFVDMPAAYVRFTQKGSETPLGTYLLDLSINDDRKLPEQVTVDGTTYEVALRFKRTYKPYSIRLIDVRKDDYAGTSMARNFASEIRLVDETRDVDLERRIWMNNPLRFAGETFYQSGYFVDPRSGNESTVLQVVTNTGWMIPYVACMIVGTGLVAHFWLVLLRFLNRWSPVQKQQVGLAGLVVPLIVTLLFTGWMGSKARLPKTADGEMNLYEFGKTPVLYQGRVKPIETLARNSLRIISNRQTFLDENGDKQPAIRWLLDVIADTAEARQHNVFRIDNLEILKFLEIERRQGSLYSVNDIAPKSKEFEDQAREVHAADSDQRSVYQKKLLELERKLQTFLLLAESFRPPEIPPLPTKEELEKNPAEAQQLLQLWRLLLDEAPKRLEAKEPPRAIPLRQDKDGAHEVKWEPYSTAWTNAYVEVQFRNGEADPATIAWSKIISAYTQNDTEAFNSAVENYQSSLAADPPQNLDVDKTGFESYFNHLQPFYCTMPMYVAAFVLTALGWLLASTDWGRPIHRSATSLILLAFVIHTFALVARIYISGRPPVTNLYSSAVFIGWGAIVFGLLFESFFRIGIGNAISTVCGFLALGVAHFLSGDGDTIEELQAVLDTQFWLATHVVCISLGYVATFVAGFLGLLYIGYGFLTPYMTQKVGRFFNSMIYGTLCFAILFSFVGTVLGGLWADDSWGRFWGWDPKENGALIIVLWNALVLHARWGGMAKERGLAVLAIGGNIVTAWSWFGVNELGVGLHNYGFTEGVLKALGLFVASQLLFIVLGSLPKQRWWSVRRRSLTEEAA